MRMKPVAFMWAVCLLTSVLLVAGLTVHAEQEQDHDLCQLRENGCRFEPHESGFITLPNRVDAHYFYWYFESRNASSLDPLIIWIPGGPGGGGAYGLLVENGPCTLNSDRSTTFNPYSWTASANMVWLDAPVNGGFSYSTVGEDDELTEDRVAESVFEFLQEFLKKHVKQQGRQVYLVGESFGGRFALSAAHYILKQQTRHLFAPASRASIPINLGGVAIGNGLINPVEAATHFADMAANRYKIKLVDDTQLESMQTSVGQCRDLLEKCRKDTFACEEAGAVCYLTQLSRLLEAHRNPYDIRQEFETSASDSGACLLRVPDVKWYLDLPVVRKHLGVQDIRSEWIPLNLTINDAFFGEPSYAAFRSMDKEVSQLLEAGLRVLMYAGDADLYCNSYGIEATATNLRWSGAAGFNNTNSRRYTIASPTAHVGTVRSFSHLTYVKVYNAGHMVPADQPEVALDMITRFVRNEAF
uniref:Carboxypeptidase n=1 Tax=Peronospora matthiolae TaxID=2874970 RepID=A0AAV1TJR9_9STRA